MFAILPSLGWQEMFLLGLIGLLLYGRNLPQAGKTLGRYVAQFRRGFQDFKDQMDRDETMREMRKTIDETKREMQRATAVPQAIADPARAVRSFAQDALAAPVEPADDDVADEPPPASTDGTRPADKDPYADRREDGAAPTG